MERLRNAANIIARVFVFVLCWFKLWTPQSNISDTSFSCSNLHSEKDLNQITPTINSTAIPNYSSTPLNASRSTMRIRNTKDYSNLSRTLLGFDSDSEEEHLCDSNKYNESNETSSLICKNLFSCSSGNELKK